MRAVQGIDAGDGVSLACFIGNIGALLVGELRSIDSDHFVPS